MLKAIRLLNEKEDEDEDKDITECNIKNENMEFDSNNDVIQNKNCLSDEGQRKDEVEANIDEFNFDNFDIGGDYENIYGMRCAAYTIQLAVNDFLKSKDNKNIIGKARALVKKTSNTDISYLH